MLDVGDKIGDWIVVRTLGEGGMGAVYLCHNVLSEKIRAAVKVLKPHNLGDARKRFIREVETLASVRHPSVVQVLGGGEDTKRGLLFMAMELLDGEELAQRLDRGPLPWDEAVRYFEQLGGGLMAAHKHGVVHRDIKPANIMICRDGTAKLLDFGIATQQGATKLTQGAGAPGTLAYMAPEVFKGMRPDHRADIYAMGQVLWEALTGRDAFPEDASTSDRQALAQLMGQKLAAEPLELDAGAPQNARDLIRAATQPNPADRLDDMGAFVKGLKKSAPMQRRPIPPKARPTRRPKRGMPLLLKLAIVFGILSLLAILGVMAVGAGTLMALISFSPSMQLDTGVEDADPIVNRQDRYEPPTPAPSAPTVSPVKVTGVPFTLPVDAKVSFNTENDNGEIHSNIVMYTTNESVEAAFDRYEKQMKPHGFSRMSRDRFKEVDNSYSMALLRKRKYMFSVSVDYNRHRASKSVTLLLTGPTQD